MGNPSTASLGDRAERIACEFLLSRDLYLIAKNFRRRGGEIDLIMRHDSVLVFVEVRYRASSRFEHPAFTVDIHKQRKLIRTAALFVAGRPELADYRMRFDVVAIEDTTRPACRWIKDAFRPIDSSL